MSIFPSWGNWPIYAPFTYMWKCCATLYTLCVIQRWFGQQCQLFVFFKAWIPLCRNFSVGLINVFFNKFFFNNFIFAKYHVWPPVQLKECQIVGQISRREAGKGQKPCQSALRVLRFSRWTKSSLSLSWQRKSNFFLTQFYDVNSIYNASLIINKLKWKGNICSTRGNVEYNWLPSTLWVSSHISTKWQK